MIGEAIPETHTNSGDLKPWQRLRQAVGPAVLLPLGLALALIVMSRYSFLLFHTFAEMFAIVVGLMAFIVAWSAYPFSRNNYLMYLGTGYFWIALLDLLHTLTFKGMAVFPPFPATHPAAQLWIAARSCEAILLLSAPLFLTRPLQRGRTFVFFGAGSFVLFALIASGNFPAAVIKGQGLTTFKVVSEYFIMGAIALAMVHLWRQRALIHPEPLTLILLANACTIGAEFAFTLYIDAYDLSNLVGHILKLFAFFFIFLAIVRYTLRAPVAAIASRNAQLAAMHDEVNRNAEQARRAEHDLAAILDNLPALVSCWDSNLHNRFANKAYLHWFGLEPGALRGRHVREALGETFYASQRSHIEAALRGESRTFERELPAPDGSGTHTMLVQYTPESIDGEVRGFYVLASDITLYKTLESDRTKLTQQLQQAQKMEAIGQLTGGIAHDFNNILGIILGYATMAKRFGPLDPSGKLTEYLVQIDRASTRAKDLVEKMLVFARGRGARSRTIDLRESTADALALLKVTLPATVELTLDNSNEVPPVQLSLDSLHQIITNLVINARDAIKGQGHIAVGVFIAGAHGARCDSCHSDVTGQYVTLSVADNGPGISNENLGSIFDPFFSTKGVGEGSGLGLSIIHGLVHESGGHILVDSSPKKGTTFRILLPVATGEVETEIEPEAAADVRSTRRGRVLVVDDEPALAGFMGELVELAGYEVSRFTDSRAALDAVRTRPDFFDAMITDQTMPGMTGLDLLREVRKLRPDMPILMASGYSEAVGMENAKSLGIDRFFHKPVEADEILKALEELLGEPK